MFKTPWIVATVETELSINHEHLRQAHARILAGRKAFEDAQQTILASIALIERARTVSAQAMAISAITLPESDKPSVDGKLAGGA